MRRWWKRGGGAGPPHICIPHPTPYHPGLAVRPLPGAGRHHPLAGGRRWRPRTAAPRRSSPRSSCTWAMQDAAAGGGTAVRSLPCAVTLGADRAAGDLLATRVERAAGQRARPARPAQDRRAAARTPFPPLRLLQFRYPRAAALPLYNGTLPAGRGEYRDRRQRDG